MCTALYTNGCTVPSDGHGCRGRQDLQHKLDGTVYGTAACRLNRIVTAVMAITRHMALGFRVWQVQLSQHRVIGRALTPLTLQQHPQQPLNATVPRNTPPQSFHPHRGPCAAAALGTHVCTSVVLPVSPTLRLPFLGLGSW